MTPDLDSRSGGHDIRVVAAGDVPVGLAAAPGTYALVLYCPAERTIEVGRLGALVLARGWYVYVGSAFGPGGVRARVGRHCRYRKIRRWHIDYVRPLMRLVEAWCSYAGGRCEHVWAGVMLEAWRQAAAIDGFGASDCRCRSHLFFLRKRPELRWFRRAAGW